jgi:hypothetical protein
MSVTGCGIMVMSPIARRGTIVYGLSLQLIMPILHSFVQLMREY